MGCAGPPVKWIVLNNNFMSKRTTHVSGWKPTIFLTLVKKPLCRSISSRNLIADLNFSKMSLGALLPPPSLLNDLLSCSFSAWFSTTSCSRCSSSCSCSCSLNSCSRCNPTVGCCCSTNDGGSPYRAFATWKGSNCHTTNGGRKHRIG